MNHTVASCGHLTASVGFENSIARKHCESEPCWQCQENAKEEQKLQDLKKERPPKE